MAKKLKNVTIQLTPDGETPVAQKTIEQSLFLKAGFKLDATVVVVNMDPTATKGESLGHLWADVSPCGGGYTFELATELPYYLPDLDGCPEYVVNVDGRDLLVCNRMVRLFFGKGLPDTEALEYWLAHRCAIPQLTKKRTHRGLHPLPMKSFVSTVFKVENNTAEEAVDDNFFTWIDQFVPYLSKLTDAFRIVGQRPNEYLLPHSSGASFPLFWVAVLGEHKKASCAQFMINMPFYGLRAVRDVKGEDAKTLKAILSGHHPVGRHESALALSAALRTHGYNELCLVQLCTACEICLSDHLRRTLLERGMSKEHLDKYFDDLAFSQLLNLHLPNMLSLQEVEGYKNMLATLNWARKKRNQVIHEGMRLSASDASKLPEVLEACRKLVLVIEGSQNSANQE